MVTGAAAGLVGVGGGEFRMPVLVRVVNFPLRVAAGVNLAVGLVTVIASLWRRWGQRALSHDEIVLGIVMTAASVFGGVIGSLLRKGLRFPILKWAVSGYLTLVGTWMIYEGFSHTDHILISPAGAARAVLGFGVSGAIAVLSGLFGVAGGEIRIPALMYLFGLPIKAAGTLSLLVSIPTVASAGMTDRRTGQLPDGALGPALAMAAASVVGVLIGAAFLPLVNADTAKSILGVILILATVRMVTTMPEPG
jgi:uncharacterized membrane protein YfcA